MPSKFRILRGSMNYGVLCYLTCTCRIEDGNMHAFYRGARYTNIKGWSQVESKRRKKQSARAEPAAGCTDSQGCTAAIGRTSMAVRNIRTMYINWCFSAFLRPASDLQISIKSQVHMSLQVKGKMTLLLVHMYRCNQLMCRHISLNY